MEAKNTKLEQAREFPRPPSVRYGVALLLTGLAAAFDFLIPELGSQVPFFSFYLSTSVAAWFGGLRAGLLSTAAAFFALVHPEDREKLRAMQIKALASHGIVEMEYRIVRPDGAVRRIHDRGQVTQHENGKAVQITGMVMDVTERKQAEETLRASEQRWRAIFDDSPVGIALADENAFFTLTNRAYQELVGYTGEELRSMTYLDLTYDEDRTANLELGKQLWSGELHQFQHEKRYRRKDGKLNWVMKYG